MNLTITNPVYTLESKRKLFVFADTPHLLKSLRNHLIDTGFMVDGKLVSFAPIKRLVDAQNSDIKIAHKLSSRHFPTKNGGPNILLQRIRWYKTTGRAGQIISLCLCGNASRDRRYGSISIINKRLLRYYEYPHTHT